jgi:hypothetical protein
MKIMAANASLSARPTRLSFPLPLTKAAFNIPLYLSSEPPYRPPPIVYQEPKKKSLWPWLLPLAGVGADLAFNQGKFTSGAANWVQNLFRPKSPVDRWVKPNIRGSNLTNFNNLYPGEPNVPYPHPYWEAAGKTVGAATLPLGAGTLGAWATRKGLEKHAPTRLATGRFKKPTALGRFLKLPGRMFAGTLGLSAAAEAGQDPISRELAADGSLLHTPVGAGIAESARWALPGPISMAVNLGYEAVKPDTAKNLETTALRADSNASQMDTALAAYRAARAAGGRANMQDAARGLRTAFGGTAGSEAPQLTWGSNLSKIWDYLGGQGSTGDIDLENPALRSLMHRMAR